MRVARRFTHGLSTPYDGLTFAPRRCEIRNPDGSTVFAADDIAVPEGWSQVATDILAQKYLRKAGVPAKSRRVAEPGIPEVLQRREPDVDGLPADRQYGREHDSRQVFDRLAGCWAYWGLKSGMFDTPDDAVVFYDELRYMMARQMCAPNSPQWFNTGLHWAYGIDGPAQGHRYVDPKSGEVVASSSSYERPQPHACQPYDALISTPQGPIAIGDIVSQSLVGLEVYDGTGEGAGTTKVVAVKDNGEKPVFRIVLKCGATIEATGDHLVHAQTERRKPGDWRRVDELRAGMRMQLSTTTTVTKESSDLEAEEAALAGWLQGDGFVGQYAEGTNRSLTMELMTVDDDEYDYAMERLDRVLEGVHRKVRAVDSADPDLDVRRIRLYGEVLRPFVEKYGLNEGRGVDLKVPERIRTAGKRAQTAYLRALFQADGTVRTRVRSSRTADVVLTTISHDLARGVQAMLLNLGIYARVQAGVERRENRHVPWFVSIGYAQSRQRFADLVGFVSQAKRDKLARATSGEFAGKNLPPMREEVISRIELVGTVPVYDIQTESGQYLCNNVLVHNCFIQSISDDLVNEGGIMDLWTREARLFKFGSGTGTNFSSLRGEGEPLSGGGRSSGLMSFLKIGDRAAGAIKSGGTTRRAAKMVCLDLDHPDIESFVNWKVIEEQKVASLVTGSRITEQRLNAVLNAVAHPEGDLASASLDQRADPKHNATLASAMREARSVGVSDNVLFRTLQYARQGYTHIEFPTYDTDWQSDAYQTVSGQNSNNSVRIPNAFMDAVLRSEPWALRRRLDGSVCKTLPAEDLWEQICYAAWSCADPGVQFDTTINEWHTCTEDGRINASNPCSEYMFLDDTACFAPETRISTPDGLRQIADLYRAQEQGKTVLVTTDLHTEHDHRRVTAHRPAVVTRVGEREVFTVSLKDGRSIRLTADHKLLTDSGLWKRVDELEVGFDRIEIRHCGNPVSFASSPEDVARWRMLGWLTGDGVFSKDTVALVFGPHEADTGR